MAPFSPSREAGDSCTDSSSGLNSRRDQCVFAIRNSSRGHVSWSPPYTPPAITFLPIFGNSGFISEHFASLDAIILTSSTQPLPRNHRAEAVWSQRSAVAINNQLSQGKRWLAGRPAVSMSEQSDDDTRGWARAASHDNTHNDDNIAGLTTAQLCNSIIATTTTPFIYGFTFRMIRLDRYGALVNNVCIVGVSFSHKNYPGSWPRRRR